MWDLFDFNSDGKTNIIEKVVGIRLLDSIVHDTNTTTDNSEFDGDEIDKDDSDEFDEDD